MRSIFVFLFPCFSIIVVTFSDVQVRRVGQFPFTHAAFTYLYENKNFTKPGDRYDLLLSSFSGNPFTGGTVDMVRGIGNHFKSLSSTKTLQLANSFSWPNEVAGVPGMYLLLYQFVLFLFKLGRQSII